VITVAFRRIVRLIVPGLVVAGALTVAGVASAEHPQNSEPPSITGPNPPSVGSVLTGNNGSWIYSNGSSCGSDCSYTFEFLRCTANTAANCAVARSDSSDQHYTVQGADAGHSIVLKVTAHKTDCNAHGVDCRPVTREAFSSPTGPVGGSAAAAPAVVSIDPGGLPSGVAGSAYSQALSASGSSGPYSFSLVSGALPAGLSLASGGTISGTPAEAGTFAFTVRASGSGGAAGTRAYTLRVDLALAPGSLADGVTGVAYSQQLAVAAGGAQPLFFRLSEGTLPDGLGFTGSGVLSGTPTKAGSFPFVVEARDARGATGRASYTVRVGHPSLTFGTATRPATSDKPYRQRLTVTGGTPPYTWLPAEGAVLPPGLTLGRDGVLRGTPSAPAGRFAFDVTATDNFGAPGRATVTLELLGAALLVRPTGLAPASVGRAYSASLRVAGGKAPYRFSRAGGRLPAGLRLTTAGRLVGTPRVAGAFRFVVRATDANGAAKTRAYVLRVTR
jgi:large repetitive protein